MTKLCNNNIDYTEIEFGSPTKGNDGKYFIKALTNDNEILFQLTKLHCKSDVSCTFDVQVTNEGNVDMLREAEDQMLSLAKDNKEIWFPDQDITDDYLDNAFMSFIKPIKKSNDVNFRMRTSSKLSCFDSKKDEVNSDTIQEGMNVSCIIQLNGIWFTKSRFGVVWKVYQIIQNKEKKKEKNICLFEDAEEDEENEMENAFPDE